MRYIIKNQNYEALIDTLGAEVIELKKDNKNILWNRDTTYWGDSALVLFPFIGRNYNDTYLYKDKEYNIQIHGFAPKSEFTVLKQDSNSIFLSLSENEETLKVYPFSFTFNITYSITDFGLQVDYSVLNTSNDTMYFTCGYHPGFQLEDKLENYRIYFPNATDPKEICIVTKCMLTGETKDVCLADNCLPLSKDLFKESAKIYSGVGDTAILLDKDNNEVIKLKYNNFENIVLWQTLNSDAPFICIEGWRGLPGTYEHIDDIEKVNSKTALKPNEEYSLSAQITF